MNAGHVIFELSAARMHLDDLIHQLEEGQLEPDNDGGFQVFLEHVIDHLCFAWSSRDLEAEELFNLSQIEFERLHNTVPDMFGARITT